MGKMIFQRPEEVSQETLQGGPGVPPGEPVEGASVPQEMQGAPQGAPEQLPPLTIGEYGPILNYVYAGPKREPFSHPELGPFADFIVNNFHGESGFYSAAGMIFYKEGKNVELVPNPGLVPESAKVVNIDKQMGIQS